MGSSCYINQFSAVWDPINLSHRALYLHLILAQGLRVFNFLLLALPSWHIKCAERIQAVYTHYTFKSTFEAHSFSLKKILGTVVC